MAERQRAGRVDVSPLHCLNIEVALALRVLEEADSEAEGGNSDWVARNARAGSQDASTSHQGEGPAAAAAAAAPSPISAPSSTASSAAAKQQQQQQQQWAPTDAWLEGTVKKALSLGTLLRLVAYLGPLLERHAAETGGADGDEGCIEFVRSSTVVGVLPQPHPIVQRVYQPNAYTALWFSTFTWSSVYLACARELPLFDARAIRLFQIALA